MTCVTLLNHNDAGVPPEDDQTKRGSDAYASDDTPVFAVPSGDVEPYLGDSWFFPWGALLDEDLQLVMPLGYVESALAEAQARL